MTVYNQHTVTSVSVGSTGHMHSRSQTDLKDETPTAIECDACEPFLSKEGWVANPANVPLTGAQVDEQERVEREGSLAVRQVAEALADTAAAALVRGSSGRSAPRAKTARKT